MSPYTHTLKSSLFSTTIHAVTGMEVEEGTLLPGTKVRKVTKDSDALGQPTWNFQASTNKGKTWFWQRSHANPCK